MVDGLIGGNLSAAGPLQLGRGVGGAGGGPRGVAGRPRGEAGPGMALRPEGRVMRPTILAACAVMGMLLVLLADLPDVQAHSVGTNPPTALTIDKDGNFSFDVPDTYTATGAAICPGLPPPLRLDFAARFVVELPLHSGREPDLGHQHQRLLRKLGVRLGRHQTVALSTPFGHPLPLIILPTTPPRVSLFYAVLDSGDLRYYLGWVSRRDLFRRHLEMHRGEDHPL